MAERKKRPALLDAKTSGKIIRSLREEKHMTQAQLAELVGVSDKAVSKWERGISHPDVSLYPVLSDVLGVTADDLLKEWTEEGRPSRLVQIFEMSPDIRTPLHIILGCVDMAETYQEDRDLMLRYLESIRVSGEYLLDVIDQAMQVADPAGPAPGWKEERKETVLHAEVLQELGARLKYGARPGESASFRKELAGQYDFSGKRILVAEDLEVNREIAKEILKQTGAEVEFAEDGKICLEKLEAAPEGYYDLILMDIRMPNMDGMEATRQIRKLADEKKAAIPVIAMTANVHEKDRNAAYAAGMNDFTEKPVFAEKLFLAMQKFL